MANQFTKGTRTQHDESTKDQIRAELLSKRYYKFAMSKGEKAKKMGIGPAQVAAAKMLIDKGKPSLQSVESKDSDPLQDLSEQGLVDMAKALILQHPEVIRALNLIPDPAVVQQTGDMGLVSTITEPIESTGTTK